MTPFIDPAMNNDITYAIGGMLAEILDGTRTLRRLLLAVLLLLAASAALMLVPSAGEGAQTCASVLMGTGACGVALCTAFTVILTGRRVPWTARRSHQS